MRKILEGVSIVALGLLVFDTLFALYGPFPVRGKVPSHFDMAGHPDRWSDPASLQNLPVAALIVYLLLTFVAIYPSLAEQSTSEAPRIPSGMEVLATGLVTWIKMEAVWIFAIFQMALIEAARNPDKPVSLIGIWILTAAVAVTILWHVAAMVKEKRSPSPVPVREPEVMTEPASEFSAEPVTEPATAPPVQHTPLPASELAAEPITYTYDQPLTEPPRRPIAVPLQEPLAQQEIPERLNRDGKE
jgi:hypothetical protein